MKGMLAAAKISLSWWADSKAWDSFSMAQGPQMTVRGRWVAICRFLTVMMDMGAPWVVDGLLIEMPV